METATLFITACGYILIHNKTGVARVYRFVTRGNKLMSTRLVVIYFIYRKIAVRVRQTV